MLIVSVVLAIIPLLGVGLILFQDPAITVDNLFVSLMLLTISAVFALNALLELKPRLAVRRAKAPQPEPAPKDATPAAPRSAAAAAVKPEPSAAPKPSPKAAEAPASVKPDAAPAENPTPTEVTKVQAVKQELREHAVIVTAEVLPAALGTARGIVRDVQFFEAPVGQPNKSIVTLQVNGDHSAKLFAFEGDLRSALPVGKKVEISFRQTEDAYDLQGVNYL